MRCNVTRQHLWTTWCYTVTTTVSSALWWAVISRLMFCKLWGAMSQDSIYEPPDAILSPPQWVLHYDGRRWESFWSSVNCKGQSHKTVSLNHNFWRKRRAEVGSSTGACLTARPNWLTKDCLYGSLLLQWSFITCPVLLMSNCIDFHSLVMCL